MGAGIAQVGVECEIDCTSIQTLPTNLVQVSLQKGYNVILKDTTEQGVVRGYQQVYTG